MFEHLLKDCHEIWRNDWSCDIACGTHYVATSGFWKEFFEKYVDHVQALETMGRLKEINGIVCVLIDKLPGIREKRVIHDDNWEGWNLQRFVEDQQKWIERNPIVSRDE